MFNRSIECKVQFRFHSETGDKLSENFRDCCRPGSEVLSETVTPRLVRMLHIDKSVVTSFVIIQMLLCPPTDVATDVLNKVCASKKACFPNLLLSSYQSLAQVYTDI